MIRLFLNRLIMSCGMLVLLALFALAPLNAEQTKKPHTHKHTKTHAATTRTGIATPHLDPAHKLALIEEISKPLNEPEPSALSYPEALNEFFAALRSHDPSLHTSPATDIVRVLQFGDSHTAADLFTSEARQIIQQKFGNGGIGFSFTGHPFAGYKIFGSSRSQTTGWTTAGNKFTQLGDAHFGLGGISITTDHANESVTLDTPCTTLDLQYLAQPGGGTLQFTDNGLPIAEITTDAPTLSAGTYTYQCPAGDHHFAITTNQAQPVTLLGWVATQPGVTWECLGINGSEAPLILKWDQSLFSKYLKDAAPALIVLAYGTNEAASPHWDEENYSEIFAKIIDTFHTYLPNSDILVVGPPDRSTIVHRAWHPYEGTKRIIEAQRNVCRTHRCAYWDQRERMGGLGAMQQWVAAGWAQPDHTHLTGDSYRALARAMLLDLMSGYKNFNETLEGAAHDAAGENHQSLAPGDNQTDHSH